MSIFSNSKSYAGNWNVKSVTPIPQDDIDNIKSAHVVNSQYGLSVCFLMKAGNMFFIPVDKNSNVNPGDNVDLSQAKVVTFERQGDADIQKIRI